VRIERVEVAGFGCLVGREFEFAPGLNVICGPNEAGKSTLLQAVLALLYGLLNTRGRRSGPTVREQYQPWQGGRYAGAISLVLDAGEKYTIERGFDSQRTTIYRNPGATDITQEYAQGRHGQVDFADRQLGMSAAVFQASAWIRQDGLHLVDDDVAALHGKLETLADTGGLEQSAQKALECLEAQLRTRVNPLAHSVENSQLLVAQRDVEQLERKLAASQTALENLCTLVVAEHEAKRRCDELDEELRVVTGATAWREREDIQKKLQNLAEIDEEIGRLASALTTKERELAAPMIEHQTLTERLTGLTVERLDQLRVAEAQFNVEAVRLAARLFPPGLITAIAGVVGLLLGFLALGPMGAVVGAGAFAGVALVWSASRARTSGQGKAHLAKRQRLLSEALAQYQARSADELQRAWNRRDNLGTLLNDLSQLRTAIESKRDNRQAFLGGATPEEWRERQAALGPMASEPSSGERRTRGELHQALEQLRGNRQKVGETLIEVRTKYKERRDDVADPAELDEQLDAARVRLGRIKRLQRALVDARDLIDRVAIEHRQGFAPQLAEKMSGWLAQATGQRYRHVEVSPKDLKIHVHSTEAGGLVTLDQLSRGTRDAVALLLRASVADLLSTVAESVPLFLDDPLVHVDTERCRAILSVLCELATARQIFYFTQDPRVVEWVGVEATVHELARR
jgi:DNA repair exonuclease SbcCD ATPase subunit